MRKTWVIAAVLLLGCVGQSDAGWVEFNSGIDGLAMGGVGSGRGIGFRADSSFTIDAVGLFGTLFEQPFDALVYSSTNGHQANAVLDSATATVGGAGEGWYDIALGFTFTAGNHYVLNWRPSDGNLGWASSIHFLWDDDLPATAGPATLLDGCAGFDADAFSNFLHPRLRVHIADTVPEPATMSLFALGGLALLRRRRST